MDSLSLLVLAVSVATNFIFIKFKLERKRYSDAILDGIVFTLLIILFSGTVTGLSVATLASSIVSVYLYFSPPPELFKLKDSIIKRKTKSEPEATPNWKKNLRK